MRTYGCEWDRAGGWSQQEKVPGRLGEPQGDAVMGHKSSTHPVWDLWALSGAGRLCPKQLLIHGGDLGSGAGPGGAAARGVTAQTCWDGCGQSRSSQHPALTLCLQGSLGVGDAARWCPWCLDPNSYGSSSLAKSLWTPHQGVSQAQVTGRDVTVSVA